MVTFISIKVVHDSLDPVLPRHKAIGELRFLLERSDVTDMHSVFCINILIKPQSDEKSLQYEYGLIRACTKHNPSWDTISNLQ